MIVFASFKPVHINERIYTQEFQLKETRHLLFLTCVPVEGFFGQYLALFQPPLPRVVSADQGESGIAVSSAGLPRARWVPGCCRALGTCQRVFPTRKSQLIGTETGKSLSPVYFCLQSQHLSNAYVLFSGETMEIGITARFPSVLSCHTKGCAQTSSKH